MRLVEDFLQVTDFYPGVALSRRRRVTQQFLDMPDVCTGPQHVGRTRMLEGMRRHALR